MAEKYINIRYPFQNSDNGYFFKMNITDQDAVKSDLMHLILTQKGQRFYNPEFGCNLLKFIFEPNDGLTHADIENEIATVVSRYLPKLTIKKVLVTQSEENEYLADVVIDYIITDDVFTSSDTLTIKI